MLKEKLKIMNGVLENSNYQLGQFQLVELNNQSLKGKCIMTKEQIIEELKKSAKPYEEYYLDDKILSAMLSYQNPYEFVEPILEIISTNPSVDFGMPGDLVHFVEKFYKKGYEELLIDSVKKNPTSHNILMLHRCYNDIKNPNRNEFAKVVKALKNDKSVSIEIKDIIDEYDWD